MNARESAQGGTTPPVNPNLEGARTDDSDAGISLRVPAVKWPRRRSKNTKENLEKSLSPMDNVQVSFLYFSCLYLLTLGLISCSISVSFQPPSEKKKMQGCGYEMTIEDEMSPQLLGHARGSRAREVKKKRFHQYYKHRQSNHLHPPGGCTMTTMM
jgi:hypothetical protein